jgi:hypothetical protein
MKPGFPADRSKSGHANCSFDGAGRVAQQLFPDSRGYLGIPPGIRWLRSFAVRVILDAIDAGWARVLRA